jgi:hypothetical protein
MRVHLEIAPTGDGMTHVVERPDCGYVRMRRVSTHPLVTHLGDDPAPAISSSRRSTIKVYVAGHVADSATVADAQRAVVAAGHELTHDWSQDLEFTVEYASRPEDSAQIAEADLSGVMTADAVIEIASSPEPGRGLFVELGAALARAEMGLLHHVVAVGTIVHESVFCYHPRVRRVGTVQEWLAGVGATAVT